MLNSLPRLKWTEISLGNIRSRSSNRQRAIRIEFQSRLCSRDVSCMKHAGCCVPVRCLYIRLAACWALHAHSSTSLLSEAAACLCLSAYNLCFYARRSCLELSFAPFRLHSLSARRQTSVAAIKIALSSPNLGEPALFRISINRALRYLTHVSCVQDPILNAISVP